MNNLLETVKILTFVGKTIERKMQVKSFDENIKNKFKFIPSQLVGMEVSTRLGTQVIDSGLPCDMFNIAYSTGNENKQQIEKTIEHFREKSLPFAWWAGFDSDPSWLEEELNAQGLKPSEAELAMACQLSKIEYPSYEGVLVKPATDTETVKDVLQVMIGIFPKEEREAITTFFKQATPILIKSNSPLHFFTAYVKDQPTAICSVFLSEGIASVFDVIVTPPMRGKGLGKLITLSGMKAAQNAGYQTCALTATDDAKYLYKKIGFTEFKEMWVYT